MADQQQQRALRRLFKHFEQRIGARFVEFVDGVDDSDAPAALARRGAEKRHGAADVFDRDLLVQYTLVVERALEDEEIGLALCRDVARHRVLWIDGERHSLRDFGRRRVGVRQHEARQPVSQRRLADAFWAGDQEGVGNTAAAIGGKERRFGAGVAEQYAGRARMRHFGVFAWLRAHDVGFTRLGFPAPAHPPQAVRWPDRAWLAQCSKYRWRPARAARWHQ